MLRRHQATLLFVLLVVLGATAGCGGARTNPDRDRSSSESSAMDTQSPVGTGEVAPSERRDRDNDNDNPHHTRYDKDDYFGRLATNNERRAVRKLIRRYYAAAAMEDSSLACSLTYGLLAEQIPEEYGATPRTRDLRGATCTAVLAKLFKVRHKQLLGEAHALTAIRVLVGGHRGWALVAFKDMPERRMLIHRERSAWKVDSIVDLNMP